LELLVQTQNFEKNMTVNSKKEESNQLNKYIQHFGDSKKSNKVPMNIKITNPRPEVKKFCSS
jgi:hypothetical protein